MRKYFSASSKANYSGSINSKTRRKKHSQPIGPVQFFIVDGLTHEANGVACAAGKMTFIAGALPNEQKTAIRKGTLINGKAIQHYLDTHCNKQ